jgi:hypothetical protein
MPSLGHAIPAYKSMIDLWEEYQVEDPDMDAVIQEGLNKIGAYNERLDLVPAYVLAMGVFGSSYFYILLTRFTM